MFTCFENLSSPHHTIQFPRIRQLSLSAHSSVTLVGGTRKCENGSSGTLLVSVSKNHVEMGVYPVTTELQLQVPYWLLSLGSPERLSRLQISSHCDNLLIFIYTFFKLYSFCIKIVGTYKKSVNYFGIQSTYK